MKTLTCLFVMLSATCHAARLEQVALDLERPKQQFTITVTENAAATVRAVLRASGSEFDPDGWDGLLWYGDEGGGITLTNSATGYGHMDWDMLPEHVPTNGRYTVQVFGVRGGRMEEWGRGAMTVWGDSSQGSMPLQWSTNSWMYAALMDAIRQEADAREAGDAELADRIAQLPSPPVTSVNGETGDVLITAAGIGAITAELDELALLALAEYARTNKITRWYNADNPDIWLEVRDDTSLVITTVNAAPAKWKFTIEESNAPNMLVGSHVFSSLPDYLSEFPFNAWLDFNSDDGLLKMRIRRHDADNWTMYFSPDMETVAAQYYGLGDSISHTSFPWPDRWGFEAMTGKIHFERVSASVVTTNTAVYDIAQIGLVKSVNGRTGDVTLTPAGIGAATPAQVDTAIKTYLYNRDAWITVNNDVLSVWQKSYTDEELPDPDGGAGDTHTVTHVSTNRLWQSGEAFPPAATGQLWQVVAQLQTALNGKANRAWGETAPDGTINPDPAFMVWINTPALVHASGFTWATYGAYSVLATYGTVAFSGGTDGSARFGPNLETDWFGYQTTGSMLIGATAQGITVEDGGTPGGLAYITYPYAGTNPVLWYTPDLLLPFIMLDQSAVVWTVSGDGLAVTAATPATASRGFWKATSTTSSFNIFRCTMPALFDAGILIDDHTPPVVYDSIIQIQSGGKTYRLPAQAME